MNNMFLKYIFLGLNELIIEYSYTNETRVFVFTDVDSCNKTIHVSNFSPVSILSYTHNPHLDTHRCSIVIETTPGYNIGYTFQGASAFRTLVIDKDTVYYICTALTGLKNGVETTRDCVKRNYTNVLQTTRGNTLTFEVLGDSFTSFQFDVIFFTFHYGQCNNYETRCSTMMGSVMNNLETTCVDHNVLCGHTYLICGASTYTCSDIVSKDGFNIIGFLIFLIIVLCLFFTICLFTCHGKFCKTREPEPDIPTRFRSMFDAFIAEARENEGYNTDPVDPSKFDPPPEYGSLEHIDGAVTGNTEAHDRSSYISIECPPSYCETMNNSNEYFVCSHI